MRMMCDFEYERGRRRCVHRGEIIRIELTAHCQACMWRLLTSYSSWPAVSHSASCTGFPSSLFATSRKSERESSSECAHCHPPYLGNSPDFCYVGVEYCRDIFSAMI